MRMAGPFLFDSVTQFGAAAIGEPGKRLFFLVVGANDGWVRVWLEKEQLRALAEGFGELLGQIGDQRADQPGQLPAETTPSEPVLGEFSVGRMAVGYDSERDVITFVVHEVGNSDSAQPTLACRTTRQQAAQLAAQSIAVCNAGRPICPLCERPIDPAGHLCPRSNGHRATGF